MDVISVIRTKVFRVFLLAIQSNLLRILTSPPPPEQSGLKLVVNVIIIYECTENSNVTLRNLKISPETSRKLYVHEFGFCPANYLFQSKLIHLKNDISAAIRQARPTSVRAKALSSPLCAGRNQIPNFQTFKEPRNRFYQPM